MKNQPATRRSDELRPEYDLARLPRGVRGKYYRRATGTNRALIDSDLTRLFPDTEAVIVHYAFWQTPLRLRQEPAVRPP